MIYKVGITGGIGCGKSTVCSVFEQLGIPSFSADAISHELSHSSGAAFELIVAAFSVEILNSDGEINRNKLGDIIFQDPLKKAQLENILHPQILFTLHARAQMSQAPYCVLDIPLLINTAEREKVDRILLVDCKQSTRKERIIKRSNWSTTKIQNVMQSQPSDYELQAAADDVIDNNHKLDKLMPQVKTLHAHYLYLAAIASNKG